MCIWQQRGSNPELSSTSKNQNEDLLVPEMLSKKPIKVDEKNALAWQITKETA